jgi:predicted lipoprotein with Yx(FWY)xxD motif
MTNRVNLFRLTHAAALIAVAASAPAAAAGDAPDGVSFERSDAGRTFVTADGHALYWNRAELAAGAITCVEACLTQRRPLSAPTDGSAPPGWTVIERPDGGRQWAFAGKALYTSVADTFPGARMGAGGPWVLMFEAVALPASFTLQNTLVGRVLADHKGRTLYTVGKIGGEGWLPVTAPWLASVDGDWSLELLPDGARQWAFRGQRLFRHADDEDPQDLRGQGVDGGKAVVLEPPPGRHPG